MRILIIILSLLFPIKIQPPSFSFIVNIVCNDIDGTDNFTSGLLINDRSDHKMIFTHFPNDSYKNKVNKFIVMEKNNEASINNFCNELGSLNIYDHLDKRLNLDPNDNYNLFAGLIKYAREKHLPKIKVKYNNKKKNSKWITNEVSLSINQKNRLYKILMHTVTDIQISSIGERININSIALIYTNKLERQNVNIMITYFFYTKML